MPVERNVSCASAAAKVTIAKYPELPKGAWISLTPSPQSGRLTHTLALEIFGRRGRREIRGPECRGGEGNGLAGAPGSLTARRFRFHPSRGSKRWR